MRHHGRTLFRHDAAPQLARWQIFGEVGAKGRAERTPRFDLSGQRRVAHQPLFEGACLDGIELAVEIGVEQELVVIGGFHVAASPIAASSILLARASRDITVPIGTCTISAMSGS